MEHRKNRKHKLTRRAGPEQAGKKCWGKCGERLTLKSFVGNRVKSDGLQDYCKDCAKAYRQDHNEKTKVRERYRNRAGKPRRIGSHVEQTWRARMRQLKETGEVTNRRQERAREKVGKMRLVWGYLRVVEDK